jgi:hypothetical protein
MKAHPASGTYTPAEWQLLAFLRVIGEKVANKQITQAEADYQIAAYYNQAKATSDGAESQQRLSNASAALQRTGQAPVQTQCVRNSIGMNCTTF